MLDRGTWQLKVTENSDQGFMRILTSSKGEVILNQKFNKLSSI